MTTYPMVEILAGALTTYVIATLVAALIARLGFPLPRSEWRIGCVDGLRGYLALSVLIHHFIIWMQVTHLGGAWEAPTVHLFNQFGAGGVALFFMTTGLVFYPRVLSGFRACSWPAIYTSRLFRIVPLIVFSVAIITAIIGARTGKTLDKEYITAAAKWITSWSEPPLLGYPDSGRLNAYVLWSLWYEWLFYLSILPACAVAMDLVRNKVPTWVVPIALLVIALAMRKMTHWIPFLPLFALGMIAYECQRREHIARLLRTSGAAIGAGAALAFGMIATSWPYTFAMPLFSFFFICVACGNDMCGLLRTKGALVLGECSYGIYLLHGIVLSLLFVDAAAFSRSLAVEQLPIVLPIAASVLVLITSSTYLLVERPAMRVGSQLARRWTSRRQGASPLEKEVAP